MLGWLCLMCVIIVVGGHYAGTVIFMFLMIYFIAKEPFLLSLSVTLGATLLLYGIFEYGFNIELYRGMIFRYFAGYEVF